MQTTVQGATPTTRVTVQDVSRKHSVPESTIRHWAAVGVIPAPTRFGKRLVWSSDPLEKAPTYIKDEVKA